MGGFAGKGSRGLQNPRGLYSHVRRNVARFFDYISEGLGAPIISSLMFLAVFVLAGGREWDLAPGAPDLAQFVSAGIVIFAMAHAAFENAAFPILYDKMEGMIQDLLMAPLSPVELLAGYVLAATAIGLLAGAVSLGVLALFVEFSFAKPLWIFAALVATALLFALLGALTGLYADKWDHYSAVESFGVLPLGWLSGAFFSITALPESGRFFVTLNPVFYAIDAFRYGLTGYREGPAWGLLVLPLICLPLGFLLWWLFSRGYKLKP